MTQHNDRMDFERDVEQQETAVPALLSNVAALVEQLREQSRLITETEAHLKRLQDGYNRLTLEMIPEAMAAAGLMEMTLADGARLVVKEDVKVYISRENAAAAHTWLRDNGLGAIIKARVEVDLRAVDDSTQNTLDLALALLDRDGVEYTTKEDVHAATLKAAIRSMLERGVTPPAAISVHQFKKAEVKEPRK